MKDLNQIIDRLCPFGPDKEYKTKWDYVDYLRARDKGTGRTRRISSGFLIDAEDERVRSYDQERQ